MLLSAGLDDVNVELGRVLRQRRRGVASDRAAVSRLSNAGDIDGARAILEPHVRAKDAQPVIDRIDVRLPHGETVGHPRRGPSSPSRACSTG